MRKKTGTEKMKIAVFRKHKDGTDIPKAKWGTKQGNWQKVHPLDR